MIAANSKKPRTRGNEGDDTISNRIKKIEDLIPVDANLGKDKGVRQQTTPIFDNGISEEENNHPPSPLSLGGIGNVSSWDIPNQLQEDYNSDFSANYAHSNEIEPHSEIDYENSVSQDVEQWITSFTAACNNDFAGHSIDAFQCSLLSSPLGCSTTATYDHQNEEAATVNLTDNIQQNSKRAPDGQREALGHASFSLPGSGAPIGPEPCNFNGIGTFKLTKTTQATILDDSEGLAPRCRCLHRVIMLIEELGLEPAQSLGKRPTRLDRNLRWHKMAIQVAQQTLSCDLCCSRFESLTILNLLSDQLTTLCKRLVRCYTEPRQMCLVGEGTGNTPSTSPVIRGSVFLGEYELDCAVEREMVLRPLILIQLRQLRSLVKGITQRKESFKRPAFAAEVEIAVMMETIRDGTEVV
ncbi:hypothetical protein GGR57DRAFT_509009 [Xylariaceae sp. FL1272]|nr:hypothetical protein GGR57DRAFT_509009 [Xylariaceae sp. FL1272]